MIESTEDVVARLQRLCNWPNPAVVRIEPADVKLLLKDYRRVQADNAHLRREKELAWGKING